MKKTSVFFLAILTIFPLCFAQQFDPTKGYEGISWGVGIEEIVEAGFYQLQDVHGQYKTVNTIDTDLYFYNTDSIDVYRYTAENAMLGTNARETQIVAVRDFYFYNKKLFMVEEEYARKNATINVLTKRYANICTENLLSNNNTKEVYLSKGCVLSLLSPVCAVFSNGRSLAQCRDVTVYSKLSKIDFTAVTSNSKWNMSVYQNENSDIVYTYILPSESGDSCLFLGYKKSSHAIQSHVRAGIVWNGSGNYSIQPDKTDYIEDCYAKKSWSYYAQGDIVKIYHTWREDASAREFLQLLLKNTTLKIRYDRNEETEVYNPLGLDDILSRCGITLKECLYAIENEEF